MIRYMLTCPYMLTPNGRENTDGMAIRDAINRDAENQEATDDRRYFERELEALGDAAELYGIAIEQYDEEGEE